jgi:hypothetical protein
MKTKLLITGLTVLALSTLNSQLSTAFAQGSLTPPGAPAPTMKSADQIEPRTIVNAVNTPGDANNLFIITNSGSYYLTTNLVGALHKNGIEITVNNVTLDLKGFALQLQGGSPSPLGENGINIPGAQTNITVRNGTISGWGFCDVSSASSSMNLVLERLNVSDSFLGISIAAGMVRDCNSQNTASGGIDVFVSGSVSGCSAQNNGAGYGIQAVSGNVSGCTADNNNGNGIYVSGGNVSGCTADNNNGTGIYDWGGTVTGCSVQGNNGYGISVWPGSVVTGCNVKGNLSSGIYVMGSGSEIIGNTCNGNNSTAVSLQAGIFIVGSNNRVENNHVTANGSAGIQVLFDNTLTNNIIIKNSVSGNGVNNYVVPAGNDLGPVGTAATATSPWANVSH